MTRPRAGKKHSSIAGLSIQRAEPGKRKRESKTDEKEVAGSVRVGGCRRSECVCARLHLALVVLDGPSIAEASVLMQRLPVARLQLLSKQCSRRSGLAVNSGDTA